MHRSRWCLECLRDSATRQSARVSKHLRRGLGKRDFNLVYADPPYDFAQYDELLAALDRAPLVPGAIVAVEHRRHTAPFTTELHNLTPWRRNEYGEVWISMFSRN
jgi:16S rRNA G966 N2-methylase RsmD